MLFDLDGTLVDTVSTRLEAWLRAFEEFQIRADRDQVKALIGSDGRRLARVVAESAHVAFQAEQASAIDRRAGEIYNELNTDPRPLPGVKETLAALDARGVRWAIATSSLEAQVRASVDALVLTRRPLIVDGSHVAQAKPAPDLMLRASVELRVSPARTWCVGDATWDMQAAKSAGMPSIGVTTGFATAGDLEAAGAWLVIDHLDRMIALLG
ncbi:MAG TPA: HAD family hydrolase [Candidatus Dormibacteraeota bacterium]|nr:HAD family hydrolase [Candidatus Dormibacteraeota bacterium]